ncbi:hypothetical protein F4818DRAFT_451343 [Hypoxylon cercidicola]|nr:hypothetical protein F4818DRAFT_451343 [Hypoxylon cercidicola]
MPNQDNKKSCYNCVKRRIVCDKTGSSCNKCASRNLSCPGFGIIRYRFAKGAATSSLLSASSSKTEHPGSKHQRNGYKWVEYSRESMATESRVSKTASLGRSSPYSSHCSIATVPAGLSDLDPRTRAYFMHFAAHVSPFMVLFDDESNGYRHHILPLAHSEPIVERAVCIASAFHLSSRQPKLRAPAEIVRDNLIRELSVAAVMQPDLSETTWTTLILLIVSDLVTGHEDVSTLYELLATFLDARGPLEEPATSLGRFLYFQPCIIGFFTRPFSSIRCHSIGPQRVLGSPVSIFKQYVFDQQDSYKRDGPSCHRGQFDMHFPIYEQAFGHAVDIYTMRMASADQAVNLDHYMEDRIHKLRTLCKGLDPTAPGAHVVVWPIFVAAAESSSDDDRQYFTAVLKGLWERVGYANIYRGVRHSTGIKVLGFQIRRNARLNVADSQDRRAMHIACAAGYSDGIKALVEAGAEMDVDIWIRGHDYSGTATWSALRLMNFANNCTWLRDDLRPKARWDSDFHEIDTGHWKRASCKSCLVRIVGTQWECTHRYHSFSLCFKRFSYEPDTYDSERFFEAFGPVYNIDLDRSDFISSSSDSDDEEGFEETYEDEECEEIDLLQINNSFLRHEAFEN